MVLVDTSIWSLSIRRHEMKLNPRQHRLRAELAQLISEGRARIIGSIRQELLSGIRDHTKFEVVRNTMRALPDVSLSEGDYEEAARVSNLLRSKGVAGSPIDCLICAVAIGRGFAVFTADDDFRHYARHLPITIYTC